MYRNLTRLLPASYVISVRQTRVLPPASFRFHLAVDTLALSYALGTINLRSGLSPVRLRPCRAHDKKRPCISFVKSFYARSFCLCRRVSHFCPYQNKWQCPVTKILLPLNCRWWFARYIIYNTINAFYFIYYSSRYNIQDFIRDMCPI